MARPWFKRVLSGHIPAELERATYVHAANVAGFVFIFLRSTITIPVWTVEEEIVQTILWIVFASGWLSAQSRSIFFLLRRQLILIATSQKAKHACIMARRRNYTGPEHRGGDYFSAI